MKDKATDAPEQEAINNPIENSENQGDNQNSGDNQESSVVQELQKQLEESRNKYLYLFSDYETLKRNAARERLELISTAGRDIMSVMLPILDDFDRAAKNNALTEGTALIHQKLTHTLKSKGLSSLEAKAGDDFDPDQHEAVAEIPVPSEEAKGKIVDILEQGYTLGGKIIRHAKVVVGK
ncbi:MAG: nucleotide exchange factor GrpE [Chitinophagales bacterium]|nr:nucleotide exchange factor GrpE [Chitinophagales bacterium]